MRLCVINKKGGVGKTPISFSLAKDLLLFLQSNDNSVIESIYPNMSKISPKPTLIENCIYDFGGFVDSGILDIVKNSDGVIIPTTSDYNSIMRTVETIEEINQYNKKIFVLITKTDKADEFENTKKIIESYFKNLEFYELKLSKIFKNSIESGKSIIEIVNYKPLNKSTYKDIYKQYLTVLNRLKEL